MLRFFTAAIAALLLTATALPAQEDLLGELYGLGVHSYFNGEYREAHDNFSAAIEGGTRDPRVYYFRGLSLTQLGRPEEAVLDFETGAKFEAAGEGERYPIGASLQRIQGTARLKIERTRQLARIVYKQEQLAKNKQRYEERRVVDEPTIDNRPTDGAIKAADLLDGVEGAAVPDTVDAPFGTDGGEVEVAPERPGIGGEPAAVDDPFDMGDGGNDADAAGADPFGGSPDAGGGADPFGGASPDAGGGADPFGGDPAPDAGGADPFGGDPAPDAGGADPFGGDPAPDAGGADPFGGGAPDDAGDPFGDDPAPDAGADPFGGGAPAPDAGGADPFGAAAPVVGEDMPAEQPFGAEVGDEFGGAPAAGGAGPDFKEVITAVGGAIAAGAEDERDPFDDTDEPAAGGAAPGPFGGGEVAPGDDGPANPFGAEAPAAEAGGADPFGAEAGGAPAAGGDDPFGAAPAAAGDDPFGAGPEMKNGDLDNDPFADDAGNDVPEGAEMEDPFGN